MDGMEKWEFFFLFGFVYTSCKCYLPSPPTSYNQFIRTSLLEHTYTHARAWAIHHTLSSALYSNTSLIHMFQMCTYIIMIIIRITSWYWIKILLAHYVKTKNYFSIDFKLLLKQVLLWRKSLMTNGPLFKNHLKTIPHKYKLFENSKQNSKDISIRMCGNVHCTTNSALLCIKYDVYQDSMFVLINTCTQNSMEMDGIFEENQHAQLTTSDHSFANIMVYT